MIRGEGRFRTNSGTVGCGSTSANSRAPSSLAIWTHDSRIQRTGPTPMGSRAFDLGRLGKRGVPVILADVGRPAPVLSARLTGIGGNASLHSPY